MVALSSSSLLEIKEAEATLLSTSVILESVVASYSWKSMNYSGNAGMLVVVVGIVDSSIRGILFDRFVGRLTLSLRLTQEKPLDSHNSNTRRRR